MRAGAEGPGKPLRVGVDVDGVLADHVSGFLARVSRKHGTTLEYEDLVAGGAAGSQLDVRLEIDEAFQDEEHVLGLPAYEQVRQAMDELHAIAHVTVITSRSPDTDPWTEAWLDHHRIARNELVNAGGHDKSRFDLDVLIEDYGPTLAGFLSASPEAVAILIHQPWNSDTPIALAKERAEGRLLMAADLQEAVDLIRTRFQLG